MYITFGYLDLIQPTETKLCNKVSLKMLFGINLIPVLIKNKATLTLKVIAIGSLGFHPKSCAVCLLFMWLSRFLQLCFITKPIKVISWLSGEHFKPVTINTNKAIYNIEKLVRLCAVNVFTIITNRHWRLKVISD